MARWSLPRFPGLWRRVVGLQVAWVELAWGTGVGGPWTACGDRWGARGVGGPWTACGDRWGARGLGGPWTACGDRWGARGLGGPWTACGDRWGARGLGGPWTACGDRWGARGLGGPWTACGDRWGARRLVGTGDLGRLWRGGTRTNRPVWHKSRRIYVTRTVILPSYEVNPVGKGLPS